MIPGGELFAVIEKAVSECIPKPKMLIIGFPSNPTAQCVDLEFFERIVELAKTHNMIVCA
ncbi:alanine transaminase [Oligella ureolytica]